MEVFKWIKDMGFLLGYLIIPVCFFVAVIVVGLLRSHSLIEIYNDGLGITALNVRRFSCGWTAKNNIK